MARWPRLVEWRFLWNFSSTFFWTFKSKSACRGPGSPCGLTLWIKKQDFEWTVGTVLVCRIKKHTQSPIKLGKPENNFQFLLFFHHSGSATGPNLRWREDTNSSEDDFKAWMKEEEYWSWTGSHVTSHRKPSSLPWNPSQKLPGLQRF